MQIISVLAAAGTGAAVGWICGLLPVWPVARLAVASILGSFVGAAVILVFVLLTLSRSASGGLGAVSFGVSEAIFLGIPSIALIAVVGYFALRRLGWSATNLGPYGPIILGGGAALVAALWMVRGLAISGGN